MANEFKTTTELLAGVEAFAGDDEYISRPIDGIGVDGAGPVSFQNLRNMFVTLFRDAVSKALTRVITDDASLITADPTTPQTIAAYRVNVSAGELICGGVYLRQAAQVDLDLLTIGLDLAGAAAAAVTQDGDAYDAALVVLNVAGVPTFRCVFGAQALQGNELPPTDAQIAAAIAAAAIANADKSTILVVQTLKVERDAIDTIVYTHGDPSADDTLAARRIVGSAHNPTV